MSAITLHRRNVLGAAMTERGDTLFVSGLGSTTWDLASFGDRPENFYLWGAMGNASMIGLGIALAQPERRVVVITGDGEMLMGMTSFSTIGATWQRFKPKHKTSCNTQRAPTGISSCTDNEEGI